MTRWSSARITQQQQHQHQPDPPLFEASADTPVSPGQSSRYSIALLAGVTIMFVFGCVCAIVVGSAISGTLRIQSSTNVSHNAHTQPWHNAFRFATGFSCNAYLVQAIACLVIAMVAASCPSVVVLPRSKLAIALYVAILVVTVGSAIVGFSSVSLANEWLLVKFTPATTGAETSVAHGYHYALCSSQFCAARASSLPSRYADLGVQANASAVSSSQTIRDVCLVATGATATSAWPPLFLQACTACTTSNAADAKLVDWVAGICPQASQGPPNETAQFCTRVMTLQEKSLPAVANFTTPYKTCRRPLLNEWTYYAKRVAGASTILATATMLFMAVLCRRPQPSGLPTLPHLHILGTHYTTMNRV